MKCSVYIHIQILEHLHHVYPYLFLRCILHKVVFIPYPLYSAERQPIRVVLAGTERRVRSLRDLVRRPPLQRRVRTLASHLGRYVSRASWMSYLFGNPFVQLTLRLGHSQLLEIVYINTWSCHLYCIRAFLQQC